jgi:hypothetical protein
VLVAEGGEVVGIITSSDLALQAAGDDLFAALASLADEWQQAVDQGLGGQDLTILTRMLEQQGGTP